MWLANIIKTSYSGIGELNIWGKLGNILIPRVCLTEGTAVGTLDTALVGKLWQEGWLERYAPGVRPRSSSFRSTFKAACLPKTLIDKTKYLRAVLAALNKLSPNRLDTDLGCNLSLIFNLETSTPGTIRIKVRRKALGSHVIQPISSLILFSEFYGSLKCHLSLSTTPNRRQDSPSPCRPPPVWGEETDDISDYRKIPKISPSMYKPLQI